MTVYSAITPVIITDKLAETRQFYTTHLGLTVTAEVEWFIEFGLSQELHSGSNLRFLLPNHPYPAPVYATSFNGQGLILSFASDEIDQLYTQLRAAGLTIQEELREEAWGERHFSVRDPNGITVSIQQFTRSTT